MNDQGNTKFRNVLRVLGSIAFVAYVVFFIGEAVTPFQAKLKEVISVYLLFAVFVTGFFYLWKNEMKAGFIWIIWYAIQWCLVFWVWIDGDMTLILGLPIALLGILMIIYGVRKRKLSS